MSEASRSIGVALLAASLVACIPPSKKTKTPAAVDDHAKSSSDLSKKDGSGSAKPKGPVYAAPFTAEQIRRATKNGRSYRFRVETPDAAANEYSLTFRKVDDDGAELSAGGDSSKHVTWLELQQQSEFPKDKVVTRSDKIKIASGKFDCIIYDVTADEGEVWTYYFAKKLPGAPVFFYVERDGERLRTTTLVDYFPGE